MPCTLQSKPRTPQSIPCTPQRAPRTLQIRETPLIQVHIEDHGDIKIPYTDCSNFQYINIHAILAGNLMEKFTDAVKEQFVLPFYETGANG